MRGYWSKIMPSILVVLVLCTNFVSIQPQETESPTYYFTLDGIVSGGGTRVDAFYLMREHLAKVGILLSIRNFPYLITVTFLENTCFVVSNLTKYMPDGRFIALKIIL